MTGDRRRIVAIASLVLAGAVLAPVVYEGFVVTPHDLRIVRQEIPCAGLARGPVRVVLLSDVDFPRYRSNLDRVAAAARSFDPDLVLVAGDFLDRGVAVADPGTRQAAQAWFESLPARGRRLLAPGEAESPAVDLLRSSWSRDVIEPIANGSRRFEIRGQRLDVFVADRRADPAPWRVFRDGDRWTARADCRGTETYVQLARAEAAEWQDVEVELAFRLERPDARVLIRLAADPSADPRAGDAVILVHDEDYPGFRVRARWPGDHGLRGNPRTAFVPPTGVWTRCRIRLDDGGEATRIRARFWQDRSREPAGWMIDASASGPDRRRRGTIALGGERGRVQFAGLAVTDSSGKPLLREAFDDPKRFRSEWRQWSSLGAWLAADSDGAVRLLLAHTPDVALDVAALGGAPPAAILAGHTHGGQVSVPGWGAVFTDTRLGRTFDRGLFSYAGMPLFITAGVGTSVIPVRLGVPPDVALLTLVPPL